MVLAALFSATSVTMAVAQVSKQVEVSKAYTPTVGQAQKLAVMPDMTDTVKMQPEIDYSVTPRTYATSLQTPNFRPSTIAYWDYSRQRPLYVKAAVGVPLASEADAYLSTYNKDRGYAMVYASHWGDYRNRHNIQGQKVKDNTTEMSNRVGGRAGLFVGRHTLGVDLSGENQLRHRYPTTGDKIAFGQMQGKVRFGDDFTDLSRWNFNIEAGGGYFRHKERSGEPENIFAQGAVEASASLGKMLGDKHLLRLDVDYAGRVGSKILDDYRANAISAGFRYGFSSRRTNLIIGADYCYDKVSASPSSPHHILPYLNISWKSATERFVPYVEVDGEVVHHDFASLMYENPFLAATPEVAASLPLLPNEVKYNGRVGIGGNLGKGVFAYNLSAELSFADDHAYWWAYVDSADYNFTLGYQHSLRIEGDITLRPARWFEARVEAGVYAWENYDRHYANRPNFDAGVDLRFMARRFKAAVLLDYAGAIKWGVGQNEIDDATGEVVQRFSYAKTDSTLRLGVEAEWRVCDRLAIFAEGRNLACSRVYEWLNYYYDTPQVLLGVKMTF